MTDAELAEKLKENFSNADRNATSLAVHLFGIEYGEIIKAEGHTIRRIIELAGLEKGYLPELSKGVKLSTYVSRKS